MINRLDTGHHKPGCIFPDLVLGPTPGREVHKGQKVETISVNDTGKHWMTGSKLM